MDAGDFALISVLLWTGTLMPFLYVMQIYGNLTVIK
jgi:hypothetical protein